jgi:hypothetical protein
VVTRSRLAIGVSVMSSIWAQQTGARPERKAPVCIDGRNPGNMGFARNLVSKIFAAIDVEIDWNVVTDWRWRNCPASAIRVTVQGVTALDERPGALAYSTPYERKHIVIFYDRVLERVDTSRVPALMGHVIAHEIAHVLEGVIRHSESGIMKEHWNADDLQQMAWKPLPFAPADVVLIHQGLDSRQLEPKGR